MALIQIVKTAIEVATPIAKEVVKDVILGVAAKELSDWAAGKDSTKKNGSRKRHFPKNRNSRKKFRN